MRTCTKCVHTETAETVAFDNNGVCNICNQAHVKHQEIDWKSREKMLYDLVDQYKNKGEYDCIVPFSGGKDSAFQLWYVVKKLGLKPLVVRYNHWGYRPLVDKNNDRVLKILGADMLDFTSNWHVVKMLMKESLASTGDFCWHCHTGIFCFSLRAAIKFNTPLVFFGESSAEYRAYRTFEEITELDAKAFDEIINLGISADDMYKKFNGRIPKRDLLTFTFPSAEELKESGVRAVYLGNYIKWDTRSNVETIKRELGWQGQQVEGIPPEYDYEKIECKWQGVRDYCKFVKRGTGRTNHLACIDIRAGRLDRETALQYCERYDGKRPRSLDLFLEMLDMTEDEFLSMLKQNEVKNWGFDKTTVEHGEELPDMKEWSRVF